uniref:Uncharacterized protein n=1 Tax=Globodera rostochiensis TaxID=31243 RepID=A0A914IES1_GLORO
MGRPGSSVGRAAHGLVKDVGSSPPGANILSENEGELNSKGRVYVVVQVQRYQATIAPVGGRRVTWPHFVSIRDDLPSARTERPLQVGDLLELKQFDWREGFRFLLNVEDGVDITAWLNNGQIKAQAVAKEVSLLELKLSQQPLG